MKIGKVENSGGRGLGAYLSSDVALHMALLPAQYPIYVFNGLSAVSVYWYLPPPSSSAGRQIYVKNNCQSDPLYWSHLKVHVEGGLPAIFDVTPGEEFVLESGWAGLFASDGTYWNVVSVWDPETPVSS